MSLPNIETSDAEPIASQLTLAVWVLPGNGSQGHIVGQPGFASLRFMSSTVRFVVDDGTNQAFVEDPSTDSLPRQNIDPSTAPCSISSIESDWTFYVATMSFDGVDTTLQLYRAAGGDDVVESVVLDAVVVPDVQFVNPDSMASWAVGGDGTSDCTGSSGYEGRIDDVRIYDRALNEAEINALLQEVQVP